MPRSGREAQASAGEASPASCRQRNGFPFPVASAILSSAAAILAVTAATARADDPRWPGASISASNPLAIYAIMGAALVAALGLISMALNIWNQIKPRPPLRDQFAAANHTHSDMLERAEHERICKGRATAATAAMDRVEETLTNLQTAMLAMDRSAETRAAKLHGRVDDLARPLNQLIGRFDAHTDWHKIKGGE